MTLSEGIQEYLADCYGLAERTQGLYAYHLGHFKAVVGGDKPIAEVGAGEVRRYLAGMRQVNGERYSPPYVDQVYRTLNTFFRWCVREGLVQANPLERVRRPRVPKRKSPRLELAEVEQVLETVKEHTGNPERNLAMVLLMVDSGLRRGEVIGLTVRDVDVEAGVVRVLGKDKEERYVPIGERAREALRAYLAVRGNGGGALFITDRGTALSDQGWGTLVHRLRKRSGVPVNCQILRHTFANLFIANGGNLRKLQAILGHASVETTAAIYLSPELSELQAEHGRYSPMARARDSSPPLRSGSE